MVHQKNYEDPEGGKKNKSGSVADNWHDEGADDYSEKKTTWISQACIEGRWLEMIEGKRARDWQRMKYEHGWNQRDGGKREAGGSGEVGQE